MKTNSNLSEVVAENLFKLLFQFSLDKLEKDGCDMKVANFVFDDGSENHTFNSFASLMDCLNDYCLNSWSNNSDKTNYPFIDCVYHDDCGHKTKLDVDDNWQHMDFETFVFQLSSFVNNVVKQL